MCQNDNLALPRFHTKSQRFFKTSFIFLDLGQNSSYTYLRSFPVLRYIRDNVQQQQQHPQQHHWRLQCIMHKGLEPQILGRVLYCRASEFPYLCFLREEEYENLSSSRKRYSRKRWKLFIKYRLKLP
jgi:hypothetical protein